VRGAVETSSGLFTVVGVFWYFFAVLCVFLVVLCVTELDKIRYAKDRKAGAKNRKDHVATACLSLKKTNALLL